MTFKWIIVDEDGDLFGTDDDVLADKINDKTDDIVYEAEKIRRVDESVYDFGDEEDFETDDDEDEDGA